LISDRFAAMHKNGHGAVHKTQGRCDLGKTNRRAGRPSLIMAVFFVLFTVCPTLSYSVDREVVDRIVVIVNDELITYSMLTEAFKPFEKKIRERNYPLEQEIEIRFKLRNNLIQQLIDQQLTDQEMRRSQIEVSDEEISGYIERIKEMNGFTEEDLRKMLEMEGVSISQYRKEIRNLLLRNKLIQYEIKSKIVITREEIQDYYNANKAEFGDKSLDEVSPLIMDKLFQNQADEKFSRWISSLREQSQIKIIQ
jgi:peptidyl-prolyl cis-trans isomerase SurA